MSLVRYTSFYVVVYTFSDRKSRQNGQKNIDNYIITRNLGLDLLLL